MSLQTTQAIILRRRDFREVDRLLTLLTRSSGKVEAIARGVRKSVSRLAPSLEPLTLVSVTLASGRRLPTVTGSEAIEVFPRLRADLERLGSAAFLAEIVDQFSPLHQADRTVFELTFEALRQLETVGERTVPAVIRFAAAWKLFQHFGVSPELEHCVSCRKPLRRDAPAPMSGHLGGLLSPDCERFDRQAVLVQPADRETLAAVLRESLGAFLGRAQLLPKPLDHLATYWVESHGRGPLRSAGFLASLETGGKVI